jgi:hypothetical protein
MNDNRSDLRKVLDHWMEAVNGRALDDVRRLYREDAVVVPTFGKDILSSTEAIAAYFVNITDGRELQVVVRDETVREQGEPGSSQVISGIYDWRIREDGEEQRIAARFTFVMDPGSEGPILHHHSSRLPGEG